MNEEAVAAEKLLPEAQRRRYRVAATLCACQMTDGFCTPLNKPECRCWKLADTVLRAIDDWPAPPHMLKTRTCADSQTDRNA